MKDLFTDNLLELDKFECYRTLSDSYLTFVLIFGSFGLQRKIVICPGVTFLGEKESYALMVGLHWEK